jgi:tetratricopeptide (TPR) repeat protein
MPGGSPSSTRTCWDGPSTILGARSAYERQSTVSVEYLASTHWRHDRLSAPEGADVTADRTVMTFGGLRAYRNAMIQLVRAQLLTSRTPEELDAEIVQLFSKEWPDITKSIGHVSQTGEVDLRPKDALDHLSVNHLPTLISKYWKELRPKSLSDDAEKRCRRKVDGWALECNAIRNPIAHAPSEELTLPDALRYLDSAARVLSVFQLGEAAESVRANWHAAIETQAADPTGVPLPIFNSLPRRETITNEFVGREGELQDLWTWLGDGSRGVWALVGDGGKGKTTIAYEFSCQAGPSLLEFGLQGVLWLSAKQRRYLEGEAVPTQGSDFTDTQEVVDWIIQTLGWDEDLSVAFANRQRRVLELLTEFPMLIIADDIDSLDEEQEDAVLFFVQAIPSTGSRVLLTSRRKLFGLGGCTTEVVGLDIDSVQELLRRRSSVYNLPETLGNPKRAREVHRVTDGSPLYIEDLLRLAQFYSLDQAISEWAGRSGDAAREYSMRREYEKLSKGAQAILGVLAYAESPLSGEECAAVADCSPSEALNLMEELRRWNLLTASGLVEDVPRYGCTRNLAKLVRGTLKSSDQEQRILNGLRGLKGLAVGSSRVRPFIQQAIVMQQNGDQSRAEGLLKNALEEVPNSADALGMLGWLYAQWSPSPRYTEAEANFKRAIALGRKNRHVYAHWADMEFGRYEYGKAAKVCEDAIASGVDQDPFILRMAGRSHAELGKLHRQSFQEDKANRSFGRAEILLKYGGSVSRVPITPSSQAPFS